jgi:hypothetical protein
MDSIWGVASTNITSVRVLDHKNDEFTCEVEFEAELELDVNVEVEGYWYHDDYEPPNFHSFWTSTSKFFYAEVIVKFDQLSPDEIDFSSVYVSGNVVELDGDDIPERFLRER